jgi:glutamate synthase domain-containing protein 1
MYKMSINSKNKKENYPGFKIPSGCAVFGVIDESGKRFGGSTIIDGISIMHDRSNGLGGGFAAYGIYPQFSDSRAFHVFYDDKSAKEQVEHEMADRFKILYSEEIPTKKVPGIINPPIIFRYFLDVKGNLRQEGSIEYEDGPEEDYVVDFVTHINGDIGGAYIISSGKNMGVFKGVGFPEDIGEFFRLDEYKGHLWTSHGRFPTNSVGWWGGAHPFGLLNWSVVHNGEISSYGTNKRFAGGFGYECTLSTDTEVIAYLFDLLVRKQKIDINIIHLILAAPLWEEIDRMSGNEKELLKTLRVLYGGALLNGPFSIIVGNTNYIYALNDRIKLRPMVAARKNNYLYISSEEAPIRKVCPLPDILWHPDGGEPVIGTVKGDKVKKEGRSKSAGLDRRFVRV